MIKYNINNSSYSMPETIERFITIEMKKGKKDMYIVSFKNGTYKKALLDNESLKIKSDKSSVNDEEIKKIIQNSFFEHGTFIRLIKFKIDLVEEKIGKLSNLKKYTSNKQDETLRTQFHNGKYKKILNPYKMEAKDLYLYCYHHFIILDEIARLLNEGKSIEEIENLKKIEEESKEKISLAKEKQYAGNYEAALEDADKALELDNQSAEAHYIKGESNFNLKKFESALEDFGKAFELGYDEKSIYIFRGKCLYYLRRFKEAFNIFNEALKLNNEDSEIYCFIGICCYKFGSIEDALSNLNKAIELKTKNPEAFYYRACYYYSNNKYIDALDDLSEAIRLDNKYSNAYLKIAVIALNNNDEKYAIDNINNGFLYYSDDCQVIEELIDILFNDFDLHRVTLYHLLGVYGNHNESNIIYLLNKMILYFLKMSYLKNYTPLYNKDSNDLFSYNRSDYDIESNISDKIQEIIESLDEEVYEDHELLFNICRFYFVYYKEYNDKERFNNIKKYFDKALDLLENDKEKSLIYYYLGNIGFYQYIEAAEYIERALNLYSDNSIYKCSLLNIFQSIFPMPKKWREKIKEYLNTDNLSHKNYLCFVMEIFLYNRQYKIENMEDLKNIITSLHNDYRSVIDINIDIDYVNSNIKLFGGSNIIERHFIFSYEALFILSNEDCNTYNMKVKYLIESGKFFLRISKYDESIKCFSEASDNIECRIKDYEKLLKDIKSDEKYYHGVKHKYYVEILESLLKQLNDYKKEVIYYSAIIKYKDDKYDEALSLFQSIDNFQYSSIYISLLYYEIGDNEKYVESVDNIQEKDYIKSYLKYLYTNNNASKDESIHLIASFTKIAQFLLEDNLKEKSLKYYNWALIKCDEYIDKFTTNSIFYYMKGMIKYLIFELDINRVDILEEAFEYLKKGYKSEAQLERIFTEAIYKYGFIKNMYREKADNMLRECLYKEALEFYYKALYIKYEEEILMYIGICQCSLENYDEGLRLFSEALKVNEESYKGYIYLAKYQYNKYCKTNDNSLIESILYNIDIAYSKASDSDKNILDEIKQYYKYELNNSVSNTIEYVEMLCNIYRNLTEYYEKEKNIIMSVLFIDIDYLHKKIVSLCSNENLGNERFYFLAVIDSCFYSLTGEKRDNVINSLEKLFENYNGENYIKNNINSLKEIKGLPLYIICENILNRNFKEGLYEKTIKIADSITELIKLESINYSYNFKEYTAKCLYELGKYDEALNYFENSSRPSDIYKYLCHIRLNNFYDAQKIFINELIDFNEHWRDYDYIKEKLRGISNDGNKEQKEAVARFLKKTDTVI
ncbi:tetratricopeptide repeat protein [Brachyspira sp. SAP_772]|uniref:tetratricopeptide repeat protein n=1 Tax=Brachyspira sp. SAP_772 TaxID=2608385 RepID=UPI0012F49FEA|nr:tetratricopeptide repeat protein [Brachyspira sp. SAP_772]